MPLSHTAIQTAKTKANRYKMYDEKGLFLIVKHAVATRRAVQTCRQKADVQQVAISGVAGAHGTKGKDATKYCNNVQQHLATR